MNEAGGIVMVNAHAISWNVEVSRPVEVIEFFSIYLIFPAKFFSQPLTVKSTRSRKMFLESRAWPVLRADNLTICEPIV
jgi:hypothetical protein